MAGSDQPSTVAPTYTDIRDQLSTWPATVAGIPEVGLPGDVPWVLAGSGASFHAAAAAAALLRSLGARDATALPSSELWMEPADHVGPGTVVVGMSRTGTTTETVQAVRSAASLGATTVGITLTASTPLADATDHPLVLENVGERGRVMTRSFSNLLLAAAALAQQATRSTDLLTDMAKQAAARVPEMDAAARALAEPRTSAVVFLGSGPGAALARQAALQLTETSEMPTEAHHVLEYRHGPLARLDDRTLVVLLSTARSVAADRYVADDTALLGGRLVVCAPTTILESFPDSAVRVSTGAGTDARVDALAALPFLQLLAWHQTAVLGKSSESVRNLDRTVDPHVNPHDLPADLFGSGPRR